MLRRCCLIFAVLVFAAVAARPQSVALPLAVTVANLPTCNSTRNGQVYGVTDADTPAVGSVVAGGGTDNVVVQCDTAAAGIKWVVKATDEGGGGASNFDELGSGTNTTAAMVVGTGASLTATGSGTLAATTAAALVANGANCSAGSYPLGVDASGAVESCAVVSATAVGGDLSGTVASAAVGDDSHAHTASTISGLGAADIDTDAIGTDELDDDANTPAAGSFVVVETGAASFDYVAAAAGTDITADLEEETHASEHSDGGADEITVTNLGSACTDAQVLGGNAGATGVECQADDDTPESGDFGAGVDLEADGSLSADVVSTAEMADADFGDFSCLSGSCTLDADVVAAAELADADLGDVSVSGGVVSLDADVVAAAEMADADHGDVSWSSGVATVDSGAVGLTEIADDASCSGGQATRRNAGDTAFECYTASAGIGGSTGSTDNAVLTADGTGGATLQASDVTINTSGQLVIGTAQALGTPTITSSAGSTSGINLGRTGATADVEIDVSGSRVITARAADILFFQDLIATNGASHINAGAAGLSEVAFAPSRSDLNTGLYSGGTDDARIAAGGVDSLGATATEVDIYRIRDDDTQSETCTDNGGGTAQALTITPAKSYVEITNSDSDGCDITISETGAAVGRVVDLTVVSNAGGTVNFADTAGVTELAGAFNAAIDDYISLRYGTTTTWRERFRSNN